jgi:hypothetical protein
MNDIPGAGDQVLRALNYLGDFAERAAPAWAGRLTIRAGYDITLTLRSVLSRLGAVADNLHQYRLTGRTEPAAGSAAADAVSEISEASRQIKAAHAALAILNARAVFPGGLPGGDPARDAAGLTAADLILRAADWAAGASPDLSGTPEDRDEIVIHLMSALDGLGLAIPNLARDAPDPFRSALTTAATCLDEAFSHLREYLIFSAAATTHLDIGELAQNMRRGIPLRAEREHASGAAAERSAAGLTASSFPHSPGDMTAGSPETGTSAGPLSAAWRPPHGRHARPPRGSR